MSIILLVSTILYCLILGVFLTGIFRLKTPHNKELQKISIIIAARNEAENLPNLLNSLKNQNYDPDWYEIIVVDDRSTDKTLEILRSFEKSIANFKIVSISKENSDLLGKKGALNAGIDTASHEILAFTDADCLPEPNWLDQINRHFDKNVDFVAGYSPLLLKNRFWNLLKNLERISIFAITAGSFGWKWAITCTARNMAYRKSLFRKINGFGGIGHIRSGDDDLLLQKMGSQIRKYNFMFDKGSIVSSVDDPNLKAQMNLESRRGSKWKYYPLPIKILTLFCFLYFIILIPAFIFTMTGAIALKIFITSIILKMLMEFTLLSVFSLKVSNIKPLLLFPIAELLYIPYFVYFGLKGTFSKYRWKN